MTEISDLQRTCAHLLALRLEQARDANAWESAMSAFVAAVEGSDDGPLLERLLLEDVQDDLPIAAKSRAFERRLELGPRTATVLRAYATHLWLHGPERDAEVAELEREIEALDAGAADETLELGGGDSD